MPNGCSRNWKLVLRVHASTTVLARFTKRAPILKEIGNVRPKHSLVEDLIDRLPHLGSRGSYLKQMMQDKLIEHKHYIDEHGQDLPEIRNWKWMEPGSNNAAQSSVEKENAWNS